MSSLRLKLSLLLLFGATALGLHLALSQSGSSWGGLWEAWNTLHISPVFLGLALALSGAVYLADALRYQMFARAFGIRLQFMSCLKTSISCLLFSWISPGAALGAPAATLTLIREGRPWDEALLISFGKSLSSSFLLLLASLVLIGLGYLPGGVRSPSSLFLITCMGGYGLLLLTPPLRSRLRILLRTGVRTLSLILASHLLYFGALISILVVLAMALGAQPIGQTYAVSSLFITLLYMAPTPAGAGIAEATANSFFGGLVGVSHALLLVLLFRAVTYYLQILGGTAYFLLTGGRQLFREFMNFRAVDKNAPQTDWAALWFSILEEQGEFASMGYGKLYPGAPAPEWVFLKHELYDGLGGMAHVLREEGYRLGQLPQMRDPRPPGPLGALRCFIRTQLSSNRLRYMPWKKYDPTIPGGFTEVAWHYFTPEETSRISARGKELGASANSLLFWSLDRAIVELFSDPGFSRQWMIPVNMRGGVPRPSDTCNHSSFIGVSVPTGATLLQVHQSIHWEIQHNSHWGNWWSIQTGRLLRPSGMRKVLAAYKKKGANWTGLFSNLGEWPVPGGESPREGFPVYDLALRPLVTQGHPVGGTCVTWNGRLGISLTFHRTLGLGTSELKPFLEAWKADILACVGS